MSYYLRRAILNGITAAILLLALLMLHGCARYYYDPDAAIEAMIRVCLDYHGHPATATVKVDTVYVVCEPPYHDGAK